MQYGAKWSGMFVALWLVGCGGQTEPPAVICHNANCVDPPDPERDDSPEALQESLALTDDAGGPMLDGMEMDLFLRGADDQCVFAHDLDQENPALAIDAATIVSDWLKTPRTKVTRTGGPYWVFLELKGQVGKTKTEVHTPAQLALHAQCAVDVLGVLADGARTGNVPLRVRFTSFSAELLEAMPAALKETNWVNGDDVSVGLGVIQGVLPPLDGSSRPLSDYSDDLGIDMVTAHAQWVRDSMYQAYSSRGWSVGLWMFSAVPETYDAIEMFEPKWITTSEAKTLTRWLAR
ncbi:MAG TPA: hypothetical protein PK156_05325 [Polyangium sp.]|nr:hypothetical protein [Polyangium sp.]